MRYPSEAESVAEMATRLGEPEAEVHAALEVGRGQICWTRLWGDPDCGCPNCLERHPGSVCVEGCALDFGGARCSRCPRPTKTTEQK